jgi:hypothetical protein
MLLLLQGGEDMVEKRAPEVIRVKNLANTLDTIQNVFKSMDEKQQKMAEIVLNAVRRSYGIPVKGEQDTRFDGETQ